MRTASQLCLDWYLETLDEPRPQRRPVAYDAADIRIFVDGSPLGAARQMSHNIQREQMPVYHIGLENFAPVAFSRGKRGIAGTLVGVMLDEKGIQFKMPKVPHDIDLYLKGLHQPVSHSILVKSIEPDRREYGNGRVQLDLTMEFENGSKVRFVDCVYENHRLDFGNSEGVVVREPADIVVFEDLIDPEEDMPTEELETLQLDATEETEETLRKHWLKRWLNLS